MGCEGLGLKATGKREPFVFWLIFILESSQKLSAEPVFEAEQRPRRSHQSRESPILGWIRTIQGQTTRWEKQPETEMPPVMTSNNSKNPHWVQWPCPQVNKDFFLRVSWVRFPGKVRYLSRPLLASEKNGMPRQRFLSSCEIARCNSANCCLLSHNVGCYQTNSTVIRAFYCDNNVSVMYSKVGPAIWSLNPRNITH